MTRTEIIKEVKVEKKHWRTSMIKILETSRSFYTNGGYYIDIIKLEYKNKTYQMNVCLNDTVLFEL